MSANVAISAELATYASWSVGDFISRPVPHGASDEEYYHRAALGMYSLPTRDEVERYIESRTDLDVSEWMKLKTGVRSSTVYGSLVVTRNGPSRDSTVSASRLVRILSVIGPVKFSSGFGADARLYPNDEEMRAQWLGNPEISTVMFEDMIRRAIKGLRDRYRYIAPSHEDWLLSLRLDTLIAVIETLPFNIDVKSLQEVEGTLTAIVLEGSKSIGSTPEELDERLRAVAGAKWLSWMYFFVYAHKRSESIATFFDDLEALMSISSLDEVKVFIESGNSNPAQIAEMIRAGIRPDFGSSLAGNMSA